MSQLFIFSTPAEVVVTLTLDSGIVITGEAATKNGRSDAHLLKIPSGTSGQGALRGAPRRNQRCSAWCAAN